ncbi:lysozyme inhibitor LprI family protein [Balneatrix alpica]|uniref:lysozyme inhibitor LprI family protein n=1 Tax=Balneatrix alpica TaxID=75684 RepID=UPI002739AAC1|nr:lysozyme inhibitor LprI family protein [Balneatrix alpica]
MRLSIRPAMARGLATLMGFAALLPLSSQGQDTSVDCHNAITTMQINQCAGLELEHAQTQLSQYLQASLRHHGEDAELVQAIERSQRDWQAYMTAHCDAVYTQWREGTIRGLMTLSCQTELTKQRTHQLWAYFLTYMDSTPPVLPEPVFDSADRTE